MDLVKQRHLNFNSLPLTYGNNPYEHPATYWQTEVRQMFTLASVSKYRIDANFAHFHSSLAGMVGVPCDLSSTMHRHSACFRVLLFQTVQRYISSVYWCIYCCCRIDALKWIAGQSVYLFLNRHGQFGVYPSKIQVTHIPTKAVREDSPLDTLAFPGDVFALILSVQ